MPLPAFSPYASTVIAARSAAAQDQIELTLEASDAALRAFRHPGQFCRVRARSPQGELHEGIFALLSAPGEGRLRFLLRTPNPEGGEAASLLAHLPIGASVEATLPAGDGFDLPRAMGRDLYFLATGTAIAPVRAAVEVALQERASFGHLRLDHGVRSDLHVAVGADLARFRAAGVDVHVHVSEPGPDGAIHGVRVQDAALAAASDLGRAAFVVAGQSALVSELRREVAARGGDPSLVLHNY